MQSDFETNTEFPEVEIFWTGGYDSTFRIVQLSQKAVCIKPYYMSDDRASETNELAAIDKITKLIKANPKTKCRFKDLTIVNKDDRKADDTIHNTYTDVLKTDFIGSQYDWLGVFAKDHEGIELCIHKDDKAISFIEKYGVLEEQNSEAGGYYVVDQRQSDPMVNILFANYHLPLAEYTKLEMKKYYLENGYTDVMNETWFCFHPKNGKPCGGDGEH